MLSDYDNERPAERSSRLCFSAIEVGVSNERTRESIKLELGSAIGDE